MDTLEELNRKLKGAKDIKSVVKAMKAMAASSITQYELALASLGDYYHTLTLGIKAYLIAKRIQTIIEEPAIKKSKEPLVFAIVFGSDLGLVGQFNDLICNHMNQALQSIPGKKEVWVIGERVQMLLNNQALDNTKFYPVPNSIDSVTPLVQNILIDIENTKEAAKATSFYLFNNKPKPGGGYEPAMQHLLPLDQQWMEEIMKTRWPTNNIPEVAGNPVKTLTALLSAYLFISIFKACAASLAAENASRLESMQRAEKSISDMLDRLKKKFQRLRQSKIDEELFDVVTGFEALKDTKR